MTASDSRRLEDQLVTIEPELPASATLYGSDDPEVVVEKATALATALKGVIVAQGLTSKISGKEYVLVEGWTLLGTMLGVFPVCSWTRPMEDGWEARVEARTLSGAIVGAAEAQCRREEINWRAREDFALRSMAQTRATAKALRLPLGYVAKLAGYETTPAEEMVTEHAATPAARPSAPAPLTEEEHKDGHGNEESLTGAERIATQCARVGWGLPDATQLEEITRLVVAFGFDEVKSAFKYVLQQDNPDRPIEYAINILRKREARDA